MENTEKGKENRIASWKSGVRKTGTVLESIGAWIFRLRKLFLSIPVIYGAVRLAKNNLAQLPEEVGIGLMANGQYAQMVSRKLAVYGPLVVTGICLLLMFVSRRALYPWLISLFSLVLPLLILFTNLFLLNA